ncbi:MAG: GntR family transcriptional regulator [Candidatus Bipolaricaulota bacterium]|nr:GntR family transcriptional regulator [Candidatus Bipolaricaulota bacterium]
MTNRDDWLIDMDAGPIFMQIAENVRRFLARGELLAGEKLPSARELAQRLSVNPNTVVHAYSQLEGQGVIETKRGLGTFVREDAPVETMQRNLLKSAAMQYANEFGRLDVCAKDAIAVLQEVLDAGKT